MFLGTDSFQEVDIVGITIPVTKRNYLVTRVEDVAPALREAFAIARAGRPGPVLVDITKDAQQAVLDDWADPGPAPLPAAVRARKDDVARAIELIHGSRRPVILAGHGVLLSESSAPLRQFAGRTETPVAMTLLGIGGFPASHPLKLLAAQFGIRHQQVRFSPTPARARMPIPD